LNPFCFIILIFKYAPLDDACQVKVPVQNTMVTIRECGKVLLEEGAVKVYACSAAIAE